MYGPVKNYCKNPSSVSLERGEVYPGSVIGLNFWFISFNADCNSRRSAYQSNKVFKRS